MTNETSRGEEAARVDLAEVGGAAMTPQASGTKWIVVHTDPTGQSYAQRVDAVDRDAAGDVIHNALPDNLLIDAMPDHGLPIHGYGGRELPVTDFEALPTATEPEASA